MADHTTSTSSSADLDGTTSADTPESSASGSSSSSSTATILDRLRAPRLSDLNRKRKVHVNPLPKGKRRARGEGRTSPAL